MTIPAALQAQINRANELQAQGNTGDAPTAETLENPEAQQPAQETPAQPKVDEQTAPQTSEPVDTRDYKQAYNVLKGKYDAEIPRLQAQLKAAQENPQDNYLLTQLKEQNSALQTEIEQLKSQQTQAPIVDNGFLEDEYGEDFSSAIDAKVSKQTEALQNEVETLKQMLNQQQSQVGQQTDAMKRASLQATLSKDGIDFQSLDTDPLFIDWVKQVDPFSGQPRMQMLVSAYQNNDLDRAALFYRQFNNESSTPTAPANPYENHAEAVAPAKFADAQTSTTPWSPEQTQELYSKKAKGLISQADFEKLEVEMFNSYK